MEFRQLKTLAAIAELGSFVLAAQTLGYAQSTITTHIQTLETELGVKLFERLGHRVILTEQGKSLLPYAQQVIKLIAEAAKITANPTIPQGTLTIGTNESLGTYRLPVLLKLYQETYPSVKMILKFMNCNAICQDIRNNKIDIGVIISDKVYENDLIVEDIFREQMLFLASPHHPLAHQEQVEPSDLTGTCVILTEPGCNYRLTMKKILDDYKVTPQSILEASSIETIKQLIMVGLGISMLPRFAVAKELAENRIHKLSWAGPKPDYSVRLLRHKDKWLSPSIQTFASMLRNAYD
jgi:DNA-binding transcriptional LysR family regulator